ncbi:hypothetical protein HZB07_01450 [Candidatus Saganbacteria bacterium]|nr:hypothetical protein [Candidatus Saganbacteria bacterium]
MLISVRAFLAAGGERVTVAPYQNRTSAAEGTRGTKENIGLNFSLVFPPAGREMRRTYQLKQNRELDNPSALPLEAHLQQKNVFLIIYNTP